MCCWNVAIYELKVHKGKIEIISLHKNKAVFSSDPHMHCLLLDVDRDHLFILFEFIYVYFCSIPFLCHMSVIYPGHPVSSINRTDRHDATAISLKVALNTKKTNIIWCSWRLVVRQRMSLLEHKLLTHQGHLSWPRVFSGVRAV